MLDVKFVAGGVGASPLTFALTELYSSINPYPSLLTQPLVLSGSVQVK